MATKNHLPESTIRSVKQQIFNKLCTAYLRFKNSDPVDANDLKRELNIPETVFGQALYEFTMEGQMAIEVLEHKGRTCVKLGAGGQDLCADWSAKAKPSASRSDKPRVDIPVQRLVRRAYASGGVNGTSVGS
jgi:hypothetical protein